MPLDAKALLADVKKIPWWGWGLSGGAVLAGVYYVRKNGQKGPSAQKEQQPPDGLAMTDLAGLPVDYYDYSAANDGSTDSSGYDPAQYPPSGSPPNYEPPGPPVPVEPGPPNPTPTPAPPGPPKPPVGAPPGPPQPPVQPRPPVQPKPVVFRHEVHAWPAWDSTLSGIAAHYGMSWQQLYGFGNDRQIIDSTAHQHGHYSQEYNYLFPGEELEVPRAG